MTFIPQDRFYHEIISFWTYFHPDEIINYTRLIMTAFAEIAAQPVPVSVIM